MSCQKINPRFTCFQEISCPIVSANEASEIQKEVRSPWERESLYAEEFSLPEGFREGSVLYYLLVILFVYLLFHCECCLAGGGKGGKSGEVKVFPENFHIPRLALFK